MFLYLILIAVFATDYDGYSCMSKWDRFMEQKWNLAFETVHWTRSVQHSWHDSWANSRASITICFVEILALLMTHIYIYIFISNNRLWPRHERLCMVTKVAPCCPCTPAPHLDRETAAEGIWEYTSRKFVWACCARWNIINHAHKITWLVRDSKTKSMTVNLKYRNTLGEGRRR